MSLSTQVPAAPAMCSERPQGNAIAPGIGSLPPFIMMRQMLRTATANMGHGLPGRCWPEMAIGPATTRLVDCCICLEACSGRV
jgi:hypothetical protein